ncbi:hypothetical protein [Rhodococcoides fascians]|uniref:hypothetical protein n=1 Tax=Rhodococcoides fascians TaxID=1828 RepID=UPI00050C6A15|nr:hypothetical protein [Rhodococcus fascians]
MTAPKLQGGPGDGAEIWRQWHFALTDAGIDLRLEDAPAGIDDAALAWSFACDSLQFLTMALRALGKDELRAKVQAVRDEFLEQSTAHDPSAN